MGAASRYWILVKIDSTGMRKFEEITVAKDFFLSAFPQARGKGEIMDEQIQHQLLEWMQHPLAKQPVVSTHPVKTVDVSFASRWCLLCFISSQIEQVCLLLESQFGSNHGFTHQELLPFVLDEFGPSSQSLKNLELASNYESFPHKVLNSFDPTLSSLSTWTNRRVKHHPELNQFLLQHGIYLISDWAILNDTAGKQLERILINFYRLTLFEVQHYTALLEAYHAIYRAERLRHRKGGGKRTCQAPTPEQLQQISQIYQQMNQRNLNQNQVMAHLQKLASLLREYRLYVRSGSLPPHALKLDQNSSISESLALACSEPLPDDSEELEFLQVYRQQFLVLLDETIQEITEQWLKKLQRSSSQKQQQFFMAQKLFHCQGLAMKEIAEIIGLKAQYQVTRLLQLKAFRADIRHQLLIKLKSYLLEYAEFYKTAENLHKVDQQLEAALDEQVTQMIEEAEAEASNSQKHPPKSLLAQRICHYLDIKKATI